jgi:hypothetical protein
MKPTKLFLDGNITNDSSVNLHEDDEFSPIRSSETEGFLMPEDELELKFYHRTNGQNTKTFEYRQIPDYLSLCHEEFSRNYLAVSGGKSNLKSTVDIDDKCEDFDSDDAEVPPHLLLKCYSPGLERWNSTFKFGPKNSRHIFHGYVHTDFNFLVRFVQFSSKSQKFFEPLFGTVCVYTFIRDELHCVSESFHFDATPEESRYHYRQTYLRDDKDKDRDYQASTSTSLISSSTSTNLGATPTMKKISFRGASKIVADSSGSNPHFNMFCVTIPEQLLQQELFLVININKVLSCDHEKAVYPYMSKSGIPTELQDHRESCDRLWKFKQPIGLGVTKLNSNRRNEVVGIYPQKHCYNETQIAQVIMFSVSFSHYDG